MGRARKKSLTFNFRAWRIFFSSPQWDPSDHLVDEREGYGAIFSDLDSAFPDSGLSFF